MQDNINYWKKIYKIHNIQINEMEIIDMINDFGKKNINLRIQIPVKYQNGGIFRKIIESDSDNITEEKIIKFMKTTEPDSVKYSIHQIDNNGNQQNCLLIDIHNDLVYLSNIYNNQCKYKKPLNIIINGSELLDIAIAFIKSKKKEYNLKKIYLRDNSSKYCKYKDYNKAEEMPYLYSLLFGDTWYGSRGFKPYKYINVSYSNDIDKLKLHEKTIELNKRYQNNKKIWNIIKVKNMPKLNKYIYDSYSKHKNILKSFNINSVLEILKDNKYNELNLGKFLKFLLDKNYINCVIFFDVAYKLFKKIKIPVTDSNNKIIKYYEYYDFYGHHFYLDL